jgi:hypothetical protein
MLNFVRDFPCIYWDGHVIFFVLDSVYLLYYIYWFVSVEPCLQLWNETNSIVVYNFLMCCCIWFASFLENFCIYDHQGKVSNFFVVASLLGFGIRVLVLFMSQISLLGFFWCVCGGYWSHSLLLCWVGPDMLFCPIVFVLCN